MADRARGTLVRRSRSSITVCLSIFTVIYVVTNLVLMDRSSKLGQRSVVVQPRVVDDQGWWLPNPPGDAEVHLRRLLGEEWPSSNGSQLRRIVPSQLRKIVETSSRCDRVSAIQNLTYLTSGWTKAVHRGRYDGREVAVKMVDRGGYDVRRCVKNNAMTSAECEKRAEDKILKEAFILGTLDNPHIVRLLDVCVTSAEDGNELHSGPLLVTELGEMADVIKLLQMSWEDRLRLSLGLSKLIHYLAHSPFGSVVINDFRRQQFVIIDGELKLVDVDDVGFDETTCSTGATCRSRLKTSNVTVEVPCHAGRCAGLNEMKNVANAGLHFIGVLLPHGAPTALRPLVNQIVDAFSAATLRTRELLDLMSKLVQLYADGFYLVRGDDSVQTTYTKIADSDLPGLFDYRCRYSVATSGCTVSVFDQKEAEDLCDFDPQCHAFVISPQKTWTGRVFAHLKNNISSPTARLGTNLYIRQRQRSQG